MEPSGCLKKRRRRAITKVKGLTILAYDEGTDNYRGLDVYNNSLKEEWQIPLSNKEARKDSSVSITISRIRESQRSGRLSSSSRVTRDPRHSEFWFSNDDGDDDEEIERQAEAQFGARRDGNNDDHKETDSSSLTFGHYAIPPKTKEALARPIFVDYGVIWTLRSWILLGVSTISFPWTWNTKTNRVDKWSPKWEQIWRISYSIAILQIICLLGFQFYQFFEKVKEKHDTYRETFMSFMSLYWYITCLNFNFNLYCYRDATRQYINSLFQMNEKFCERFVVDLAGYPDGGRILINVSFPSNLCEPFAAAALFLVIPFQKWFLYHYIYSEDNPWYWLLPGMFQEYILVGQVITSYLLISWATVAHTESVNFWLKEIHKGADSGYTIPETSEPKTAMEIYRTLQIICTMFNDCISPMGIMMVKFNVFFGIASCGYVIIRSMNHLFIEEFPGILMYPISVLDCVTAAVAILSMSAEMFDLGCGFIDSWSRTKQKDFRRVLRALPTLRVKIGCFYYITVATMLTFSKATLDLVVDAVMTFP